ncbi:hypothetical protein BC828DRAFT_403999 [Blastocladiella britannica]|nr:hypothetical protein BC828DRAFT_403999 [Blastocladiella britannica]
MYLHPSPSHPTSRWHAVYFPPSGPYFPGAFRFVVDFPPQYPTAPPRLVFTSPIAHPLVVPLVTKDAGIMDHPPPLYPINGTVPGEFVLPAHSWPPGDSGRAVHVLAAVRYALSRTMFDTLVATASSLHGNGDDEALPEPDAALRAAAIAANPAAWMSLLRPDGRNTWLAAIDACVRDSVADDALFSSSGGENGRVTAEGTIVFSSMDEERVQEIVARMVQPSENPTALLARQLQARLSATTATSTGLTPP